MRSPQSRRVDPESPPHTPLTQPLRPKLPKLSLDKLTQKECDSNTSNEEAGEGLQKSDSEALEKTRPLPANTLDIPSEPSLEQACLHYAPSENY